MVSIFGYSQNLFRLAGDSCHVLALFILIVGIWRRRSWEGVSGKTQIMFALVFTNRYLDFFFYFISWYNSFLKVLFTGVTYFTLYIIYWHFRDKDNREKDSFRFEGLVIPALVLSFFINHDFACLEIAWTFSIYLEAVTIVPQLYLMWKAGHAPSHMLYYLFSLAAYKALYVCNWVYRRQNEGFWDNITFPAGCVETVLLFYGVWLAQAGKWSPHKDIPVHLPVIPDTLFTMDPDDQKMVVAAIHPTDQILSQTDENFDVSDKTPLYSPHD